VEQLPFDHWMKL